MSDLDDTMTESQASQFMREKFPLGQGGRQREKENRCLVNGRIPDNDKEMIVALATLNKDNPKRSSYFNIFQKKTAYNQPIISSEAR